MHRYKLRSSVGYVPLLLLLESRLKLKPNCCDPPVGGASTLSSSHRPSLHSCVSCTGVLTVCVLSLCCACVRVVCVRLNCVCL
jgi:hypothetical protein